MTDAAFFRRLAAAAADQTLPRFRQKGMVSNKLASGFDPVTEADQEAERVITALIGETYPEHGILGEEHGTKHGDGRHVWVIDPIDGTRAFISGLPVWGTLVGLTENGDAVAGMMSQPFTGELFYATTAGAFYEGPGGGGPLRTRQGSSLADATLFTTTPALFKNEKRALFDRLESSVRLSRYGVDCYAFAMLAAGHADLVIEAGLQPYDIVALIPIIEQAGGVITSFDGGPAEGGGDVIAAGSAELHAAALKLIQS
ncbi:histidinol-phosphatase [Tianweitania sp. BSSL-BM11]|uniref:Histidinol-phosphatase n=1 Tax=Tianweitania aestuarii TaxID=2814886 RepID=A0ABS5RW96_9HYPH|nr:histidinol-phosphatase [Tianweitania aestuarii]MBS9721343.1 histidinol-phosphatase [Tianweitania aestuarii]